MLTWDTVSHKAIDRLAVFVDNGYVVSLEMNSPTKFSCGIGYVDEQGLTIEEAVDNAINQFRRDQPPILREEEKEKMAEKLDPAEEAAQDTILTEEWRYEVNAGRTLLGFDEWKQKKNEPS